MFLNRTYFVALAGTNLTSRLGWPQIHGDAPALASRVLGLRPVLLHALSVNLTLLSPMPLSIEPLDKRCVFIILIVSGKMYVSVFGFLPSSFGSVAFRLDTKASRGALGAAL